MIRATRAGRSAHKARTLVYRALHPSLPTDAPSMLAVRRYRHGTAATDRQWMDDGIVTLPPEPAANDANGDWQEVLRSIKARLRETVDEPLVALVGRGVPGTEDRVRARLLECVMALDELHATTIRQVGRHQELEQEIVRVQATLAEVRSELAGTQAGERRARYQALHDDLTCLPNRGFLRERLVKAVVEAERHQTTLALLYLDLDGFKAINDEHGHHAGDKLLRIVAARLTRSVRAEDVVSRLGGDEFACLLADVASRDQLVQLARKLFATVAAPVKIGPLALAVRPSIGIASYPTDGTTAEKLLQNADAAMYRAKREKTGYAFFDEGAHAGSSA